MKKLAKWQRFCWRCGHEFGPDEPRRQDTDFRCNLVLCCEPCYQAAYPPHAFTNTWDEDVE